MFLPRDAMQRGLSCHAVSVCVSDTFVHSVKTNKHVFKNFSPSDSQAILVFPYQTAWQYSNGNPPPNGGVECRWGRQKPRFNLSSLHGVNAATGQHDATGPRSRKLTVIAGISGGVCWWRETTTKCMSKSVNVTPKTTEHHLIERSDKSVACV